MVCPPRRLLSRVTHRLFGLELALSEAEEPLRARLIVSFQTIFGFETPVGSFLKQAALHNSSSYLF